MIGKLLRAVVAFAGCVLMLSACAPTLRRASAPRAAPQVVSLRTDALVDPVGIDVRAPRLSWQLRSAARGVMQSAYQIRVASSERGLEGPAWIWNSGKVDSGQSIEVAYAGPPLESARRYYWQARVWDGHGMVSAWSAAAYWEMGLLAPADWTALWIAPRPQLNHSSPRNASGGNAAGAGDFPGDPSPLLRQTFTLRGPVRSARVYVTSHGLYELYLNGRRVGRSLLTPGWTSYRKRLQYQTYDVTGMLVTGKNAIGAMLGDGWYRGEIAAPLASGHGGGKRLALLVQLQVTYQDGSRQTVVSDTGWKAASGPILASGIYSGEIYDARRERPGWATARYDDHGWSPVEVIPGEKDHLIAPLAPPITEHEALRPVRIFRTNAGDVIADMGQNMVGWVRLKVRGKAGTVVTLRHAEVLDRNGNFYTANLRTARQEIRYTLKGDGLEVYAPHFTYMGFRYVEISGYPGQVTPESITGIVVHADLPRTGELVTSNPLLNRLQHNIVWSQKGNFVSVPTDCPQRDERLGWTGDAQVFSATAAFNMDVDDFFTKWLADLAADQSANGRVPVVVPDVLHTIQGHPAGGAAGWGDAATVIPWNMYLAYGDTRVLSAQYASMAGWVRYERERAGDDYIWNGDLQLGDWLDFFSTAKHTSFGSTSPDLIATAYFAHSTDIVRRAAEVLGKSQDAARYGELFEKIKAAFDRKYVSADGQVGDGTQTSYVLALDFDLLPGRLRKQAAEKLAENVRQYGHLTTGFLGTPHLLETLSRYGYLDEAYMLLERKEFPSWLYPVTRGATTIWERWDGIKPDGTFEDPAMNSFNHYAYGAVGEWMYRVVAGINLDPEAPGYKHVLIAPQPGGELQFVRASHESPYGRVASAWSLHNGQMELSVEIPPNTRATIELPHARLATVRESGRPLAQTDGIASSGQQGASVVLEAGSGRYDFTYPVSAP